MLKKAMGVGIVCVCTLQVNAVTAQEVSANIGWNSEYFYRGIAQKTNSVFAGLDLEAGGFYLGAWGADVGDGIEIDYYGGYVFEVDDDFNFTIGSTLYTYSGDFDDTYLELNLGAEWKWLSFAMAAGKWGNFDGPKLDYQFYSLTASHQGFYGTIGWFAEAFEGTYYEAGYGRPLKVKGRDILDYKLTFIYSDNTLLGGASDSNLVLTLTKAFSF